MSSKKPNPLRGAFSTPVPGTPPDKPTEEKPTADLIDPKAGSPAPAKTGEEKKPAEQTKATSDLQPRQSVTAPPDSIVPKTNRRSLKGHIQQKGIVPKTRKQFYAKAPLRPQFTQSMGKAASRTINHTAQKRMVQQMVKQA